jgi:hypothetical protein
MNQNVSVRRLVACINTSVWWLMPACDSLLNHGFVLRCVQSQGMKEKPGLQQQRVFLFASGLISFRLSYC